MILFPAIDILGNNAVRLFKGIRSEATVFGKPLDFAVKWAECGAEYLHIVDLDGAFDDSCINGETIKNIVNEVKVPIQLGGGIKSIDKAAYYLEEVGVSRVIVGTLAVTAPKEMEKLCARFGNKIACGIDVKDGYAAIKGWVETSKVTALELCNSVSQMGVEKIIFTDISRDGAMCGVNADSTALLQQQSGLDVIASGGVNGIEDIERLKGKVYGAIIGRALYDGKIDLKAAIKLAKEVV